MSEYWNPFDAYRPELTEDAILDYFVAPNFLPDIMKSRKSVVIVGGRGVGKTTLLRYLSYESQKLIHGSPNVSSISSIGVYWRANTNYVTAFQGAQLAEPEWTRVFAHYVNVGFCKQLCEIVIDMKSHYTFQYENKISKNVGNVFSDDTITGFVGLLDLLSRKQVELERYVNNIGRVGKPILSMAERAHSTFCKELCREPALEGKWFYFLIDEYENLLEYQQRVINTFIKHAEVPYSFRVCRRAYGDKTNRTLSDSEFLSETDDWSTLDLNLELNRDNQFADFIKDVCRRRLEKHEKLRELNLTDIEYFLPGMSIKDECIRIENSKMGYLPYKDRLEKIIYSDVEISADLRSQILKDVLSYDDPLVRRLFLVLLERRRNKAVDVYNEFLRYIEGTPSKFRDGEWIHNNEIGVLFLLANEYGVQKLYAGFNVFRLLSSGNIRDFLDLCNATFRFAMRDGFSLDEPEPIDYEIQNKAARYVAQKHLLEIVKNQPNGEILRDFTLALGGLFEYFHKDTRQSEPERNQFTVDVTELEPDSRDILYKAVMSDTLLEFRGTKYKDKSELKVSDFMLHPIFSPYFKISYTKGRKISLPSGQLSRLMLGSKQVKDEVIREITKGKRRNNSTLQTSLFDFLDGGEDIE